MSLFIGKVDSVAKMHITRGESTEAVMRGAPVASTVFHSDLPYVVVRQVADCTIATSTGPYITGYALSINAAVRADLMNGYQYFVLYKTSASSAWRMYTSGSVWSAVWTGSWSNKYSAAYSPSTDTAAGTFNVTNTTNWLHISSNLGIDVGGGWVPSAITEAKIVVVNIKQSTFDPLSLTSDDVTITKSEMVVGGHALNSIQYLLAGSINSSDLAFQCRSEPFQIVNSTNTSGTFALDTIGSDTVITVGGKPIFSTLASVTRSIYDTHRGFSIPGGVHTAANRSTSRTYTIVPAGTYSVGTPLLAYMEGAVPGAIGQFSVSRYTEGVIAHLGRRSEVGYNSGLMISNLWEAADLVGASGGLNIVYNASAAGNQGGNITSIGWSGGVHSFKQ